MTSLSAFFTATACPVVVLHFHQLLSLPALPLEVGFFSIPGSLLYLQLQNILLIGCKSSQAPSATRWPFLLPSRLSQGLSLSSTAFADLSPWISFPQYWIASGRHHTEKPATRDLIILIPYCFLSK